MRRFMLLLIILSLMTSCVIFIGCGGGSKVENSKPSANAGGGHTVHVGDSVHLSGSGEDADGEINMYEWDFNGDGSYDWSSTTSGIATYVYNTAGIFNAVLRVTDDNGATTTDGCTITVQQIAGTFDISGVWNGEWYRSDGRETGILVANLMQSQTSLTGDMTIISTTFNYSRDTTVTGNIEGNDVVFGMAISVDGDTVTIDYVGTVSDNGDLMEGTYTMSTGYSGTWVATRGTATITPPSTIITATPTTTTTATSTPIPTPTTTPTPSKTPLPTPPPEVSPTPPPTLPVPAEGKAVIWGVLMWNDQPVAGATVEMGTSMTYYIPGGLQLNKPVLQTTTDNEGYYVFTDVAPGEYVRKVNAFGGSFYPDGKIMYYKFTVESGQIISKKTYHIVREDLSLSAPADEATVSYDTVTLTWEAYPDAQYYVVELTPEGKSAFMTGAITGTTYHPQSLLNGNYDWTVSAYNKNNREIATSLEGLGIKRTLTVTGAAYSIYVEIVFPQNKAKVSDGSLTLEWQPYPDVSYYTVYVALKGGDTIVERVKTTDSTYTIPESLTPGTYYWDIHAFNSSGGEIAKSIFLQFTVE